MHFLKYFVVAAVLLNANFNAWSSEKTPLIKAEDKPSHLYQHCFIWVGNADGATVDRIHRNFALKNNGVDKFNDEFKVDAFTNARLYFNLKRYTLQLFKASDTEFRKPFASGSYKRATELYDYIGFSVVTSNAEYTYSCASTNENEKDLQ